MSPPVPWTVVAHTADDSPPSVAVGHLMAWLAEQPSVELHTVLWSSGPAGTKRFDFGRLRDVGRDHTAVLPRALRLVRLGRVAGGLAGRAVRATLADVPTTGVLYLSTAQSGAVLRYLPPGERTVITHLHALDRRLDPPLGADKVARLVEVTDVWLAADDETRSWAAETFGVDEGAIAVVPEAVDASALNRAARPARPDHLRLGVAGAAWFRTDHTPRLVQTLQKLRPGLAVELVWTEVMRSPDHLAPLVHDLDHLGVADALELPTSDDEVKEKLDDIDALVVTAPDHEAPWVAMEASNRGVAVVCFDTHRIVDDIPEGAGLVVPYLDVVAMAEGVLAIHDAEDVPEAADVVERRRSLTQRDIANIGPRVLAAASAGRAS